MLNYSIITNSNTDNNRTHLLFIAGYTGTLQVWQTLVERLNLLGNQQPIILIDNLGSGQSPQPTGAYTVLQMADAIIETLSSLNIIKIDIIGHSLGGAIAQQITLNNPQLVDKLFLLSTAAKFDIIANMFIQSRFDLASSLSDKYFFAKNTIMTVFGENFLNKPDNIERAINRVLTNPQTLTGMYGQLQACLTHDTSKTLANIKSPTIIIHGKDDILISPKHATLLNSQITNSKLYWLSDCGHMIQLEQTEHLAEIIYNELNL